ncbi:hypothetical protein [Bifidobacterium cebidarum]|uniref:Uncharacterized protein n=1 Tax=Bifidobacterium cebidarum TaxID=2650773 RepID=A0A6I1GIG6_9BIFI|nr:hypothetical protein [Bifidobacterium cebidarum]KAB7789237.1 hypothetical protein F7D08_0189 [Bifidobacterium cebidarum]
MEWLEGSHTVVLRAIREKDVEIRHDKRRIVRSAIIFTLFVCGGILLLIRAASSLWVSDHGDIPIWTPGALDLPALVCGIALLLASGLPLSIVIVSSRDKRSWQRLRHKLTSDSFVGIEAERIHPGLVSYADARGNDDDIFKYPVKRIMWRISPEHRSMHVPAYVDAAQWKALNGLPDPRPKWEHRHFMAMLDINLVGRRIAVTGMAPIPVVFVERAWDGRKDGNNHARMHGASIRPVAGTLLVDDESSASAPAANR